MSDPRSVCYACGRTGADEYLQADYEQRLKASMDEMAAYNRGLIAELNLLRTVLTWTERCECGACQLCAATESYNAWRREHE